MTRLFIYGTKEDNTSPSKTTEGDETFEALINPETISHTKGVAFNDKNTANTPANDTKQLQGYHSEKLNFDIILDGTGYAEDDTRKHKSVKEQIVQLNKTCYLIDSETHKPLYVAVVYGEFQFKGQLENMTIRYNLFDINGKVLRAKVSLSFVGHKNPETSAKESNFNSPDMSHLKVFREGDSLPSMCEDIYGDMRYYIQVARVNNLVNFRDIEIGTELLFPPLV